MYIPTKKHIDMYIHTHTPVHIDAYAYTHARMHSCIDIYLYNTNTHIFTYIYIILHLISFVSKIYEM
jgi:hypothetical protein